MGTVVTFFVLCIVLVGAAMLYRRAGDTRRRSESIVATETYRIHGRDSYTIEFRHCVSTGIYRIFALSYPPGARAEKRGLSRAGEVRTNAEPRTLDEATKIAREWMTSFSEYLHKVDTSKNDLSRPAMLRQPTARQTRVSW